MCVCVGCQLHSDQPHTLLRFRRHVRVWCVAIRQHQLTRSESIDVYWIAFWREWSNQEMAQKFQQSSLRRAPEWLIGIRWNKSFQQHDMLCAKDSNLTHSANAKDFEASTPSTEALTQKLDELLTPHQKSTLVEKCVTHHHWLMSKRVVQSYILFLKREIYFTSEEKSVWGMPQ